MSAAIEEEALPEVRRARPLAPAKASAARPATFRLRLAADEQLDVEVLSREFPTITVEQASPSGSEAFVVDDFAWRGSFDFCRFDEAAERAAPFASVVVRGDDAVGVACEVMTRYQRFVARRNQASATPVFDAVLDALGRLFPPSDPLAKGDHDHALDTWQWVLRLDPGASTPAQLAALLHDIDRLDAEPHERIEHRARDRVDRAASTMGERAYVLLARSGVAPRDAERVRDVLLRQGGEASGSETALVDDADALSFLSLQSSRYADHFGLAQTRRKIAYTTARLSPGAREKLARVRLRPDIERLLSEVGGKGVRQAV